MNCFKFTFKIRKDIRIEQRHVLKAEPEWSSGIQCCARSTDGLGFDPQTSTNACGHVWKYVDQKGWAVVLTSKQSAGVTPEVNLRITQARKLARVIHPSFETQGRRHQKSKTGISVAPRKGLMSSSDSSYVIQFCGRCTSMLTDFTLAS